MTRVGSGYRGTDARVGAAVQPEYWSADLQQRILRWRRTIVHDGGAELIAVDRVIERFAAAPAKAYDAVPLVRGWKRHAVRRCGENAELPVGTREAAEYFAN